MKKIVFIQSILLAFFLTPVVQAQDGVQEERTVLEEKKTESGDKNYKNQSLKREKVSEYGVNAPSTTTTSESRDYKNQTLKEEKSQESAKVKPEKKKRNRNYKNQTLDR